MISDKEHERIARRHRSRYVAKEPVNATNLVYIAIDFRLSGGPPHRAR
jgi:hypothetical protein